MYVRVPGPSSRKVRAGGGVSDLLDAKSGASPHYGRETASSHVTPKLFQDSHKRYNSMKRLLAVNLLRAWNSRIDAERP